MKKSFALVATALFCLLSVAAFAAEPEAAAHAEEGAIPTSVLYQFINFALYAGLVFYFVRKPVRSYFQNREAGFNQALVKAQEARKEAEEQRRTIQTKITQLESNQAQSVEQARAEAEALKTRILQEAEDMARRLRDAVLGQEIERRDTATAQADRLAKDPAGNQSFVQRAADASGDTHDDRNIHPLVGQCSRVRPSDFCAEKVSAPPALTNPIASGSSQTGRTSNGSSTRSAIHTGTRCGAGGGTNRNAA